jgi:isochorismate synthase EntC
MLNLTVYHFQMQRGTVLFFLKLGPSPFYKCKGDTIPCPCLVGSAPKDDTIENRQGQGIMSPKVIYGQMLNILTFERLPSKL